MQPTLLNFIDGQPLWPDSGRTFDRLSPADGSLVQRASAKRGGRGCSGRRRSEVTLHGSWGSMDVARAVGACCTKLADALIETPSACPRRDRRHRRFHCTGAGLDDIPAGGELPRFIDMVKAAHEALLSLITPDGRGALHTPRRPKGVTPSFARGTCRF